MTLKTALTRDVYPDCGETGGVMRLICVRTKAEYFDSWA